MLVATQLIKEQGLEPDALIKALESSVSTLLDARSFLIYHKKLTSFESKMESFHDEMKKYEMNLEIYNAWCLKVEEEKLAARVKKVRSELSKLEKKLSQVSSIKEGLVKNTNVS